MSPAARLSLPGGGRLPSISIAPARFRVQGWDPILIISQIVAIQALHYLVLALVTPILLRALSSSASLALEGGASSISLIMDWRAFSGSPLVSLPALNGETSERLVSLTLSDSPGTHWRSHMITALRKAGRKGLDVGRDELAVGLMRVVPGDAGRGWAVALGWVAASLVDVVWLYHLVRRPTHILDFSLTLLFNHTLLTTYYAGSFPSHLFYWFTLAAAVIAQIVLAEQWCVRREMREGFTLDGGGPPSRSSSPVLGRSVPGATPQTGHGRSQSKGHVRGASASSRGGSVGGIGELMEMGALGSSQKSGGTGARYERVPEEEEEEEERRSNRST